jgi:cell division protein FtsI/penicillin-binding protein 2
VWVQRGLTQEEKDAVFGLGVEGLQFVEEARRVYPRGKLAGHFLGYTNIDGEGLEGSELAFDARLKAGGEPLKLTLDASVQFVLEEELERAFADFDMKGGAGVVVDTHSGAVRAVASWPALDPNRRGDFSADVRANRALNSRFELGSIYKPLTVAAAMEAGVLTPQDQVRRVGAGEDRRGAGEGSASAAEREVGDGGRYPGALVQHRHGADCAADGRRSARRISCAAFTCWAGRAMRDRRRRRR